MSWKTPPYEDGLHHVPDPTLEFYQPPPVTESPLGEGKRNLVCGLQKRTLAIALGLGILVCIVLGLAVGLVVATARSHHHSNSVNSTATQLLGDVASTPTPLTTSTTDSSYTTSAAAAVIPMPTSRLFSSSEPTSIATSSTSRISPQTTTPPTSFSNVSTIKSSTLTAYRDCPSSNSTSVTLSNLIPAQTFVKYCSFLYTHKTINLFEEVTSSLNDCIALCGAHNAAYNVTIGSGSECSSVCWRFDPTVEYFGHCWGLMGAVAGVGELADSGISSGNAPVDSALLVS
ncbi:hypothetical protein K432DRAFT_396560 [Lepidopterella palustris CBS 459.81]|uniref:Uncharacterized protein n=1 Tax=Lepidopterella palustris CBS 459.81 TaxID=1314670 RepID=A0A8E2E339_9PEZI|nr:hypothetical protein K432DRAFT_396560 [Lepidopterella palustris CBS 459.81]